MPIPKDIRRKYYGKEWQELSKRLRTVRAGNKCEWCHAENYKPHPVTGGKVVLTVAHFNHTPGDDREENLVVLCQRCHLSLDREQHKENARETRLDKKDASRPILQLNNSRYNSVSAFISPAAHNNQPTTIERNF